MRGFSAHARPSHFPLEVTPGAEQHRREKNRDPDDGHHRCRRGRRQLLGFTTQVVEDEAFIEPGTLEKVRKALCDFEFPVGNNDHNTRVKAEEERENPGMPSDGAGLQVDGTQAPNGVSPTAPFIETGASASA